MGGWYYKNAGGEEIGPLSNDEIRHCAGRGGLPLDSPVMHANKTQGRWVAAILVPGLRSRIEAYQQQASQNDADEDEAATGITGYVPPPPRRESALVKLQRAAAPLTESLARLGAAIARWRNPPTTSHVCSSCEGEITVIHTPGQCPLCGEWEKITCRACGFTAIARQFVESKCKCPRCAAKVTIAGVHSSPWLLAGITGGALLLVVAITIVSVLVA